MKLETLKSRLAKIRADFENGSTPPHILKVLNDHVDWLVENSVEDQALETGRVAPLELPVYSQDGSCRLADFKGESDHFLVLTWFRGNW